MWKESRKELIGLLVTVATVFIVQAANDPDAVRTLKMRGARKLRAVSNRGALVFLNLSDYADKLYQEECA